MIGGTEPGTLPNRVEQISWNCDFGPTRKRYPRYQATAELLSVDMARSSAVDSASDRKAARS